MGVGSLLGCLGLRCIVYACRRFRAIGCRVEWGEDERDSERKRGRDQCKWQIASVNRERGGEEKRRERASADGRGSERGCARRGEMACVRERRDQRREREDETGWGLSGRKGRKR